MHFNPPTPLSLFHLEKFSNHFVSFHLFQVISVNIGRNLNVGQNAIYLNLILYLILPFFFSISPLDFSLSLSLLFVFFFLFFSTLISHSHLYLLPSFLARTNSICSHHSFSPLLSLPIFIYYLNVFHVLNMYKHFIYLFKI